MKKFIINPSEKFMWRVAYAQAFASSFENGIDENLPEEERFIAAVRASRADYAIAVADAAILRLNQAMKDNKDIGQLIDWPEEWG